MLELREQERISFNEKCSNYNNMNNNSKEINCNALFNTQQMPINSNIKLFQPVIPDSLSG